MKTNKIISIVTMMTIGAAAIIGCSVKGGNVVSKPPTVEPQLASYGVQYGKMHRLQSVSVLLWPKHFSEDEMKAKVKVVNIASKQITENAGEIYAKETAIENLWEEFVESECIVRFRKQMGCLAPTPVSHPAKYPEPPPLPLVTTEPPGSPPPSAPYPAPVPNPEEPPAPEERDDCGEKTSITWKDMPDPSATPKPSVTPEEYAAFRLCDDNQKTRKEFHERIDYLGLPREEVPDLPKNSSFILKQIIDRTVGETASLKIDERHLSSITFNDPRKNPDGPAVRIVIVDFNESHILANPDRPRFDECPLRGNHCYQTSDDPSDPMSIQNVSLSQGGRRLKFTVPEIKSRWCPITGKYLVDYEFDLSRTSNVIQHEQKIKATGVVAPAADFAVFKGDVIQKIHGVVTHKGSGQIFGVMQGELVQ